MSGLREQPLASFLAEIAEATPAPGGGSSAAMALALGAALVEMSAGLAGDARTASRVGALRAQALELAERDLSSFAPVLEATRLPREDPSRAARLDEALLEASRTPLAIAAGAAETAELGTAVARTSSPHVRGDAVTGVLIAEATAAAAATLVEINLAQQPGARELEQARAARERASRAREETEGGRR
jgi:formiminotetrahydrofolate cyclodeaminase